MLKKDEGTGDGNMRRNRSQRNNLMAVRARMNAGAMLFSDSPTLDSPAKSLIEVNQPRCITYSHFFVVFVEEKFPHSHVFFFDLFFLQYHHYFGH